MDSWMGGFFTSEDSYVPTGCILVAVLLQADMDSLEAMEIGHTDLDHIKLFHMKFS